MRGIILALGIGNPALSPNPDQVLIDLVVEFDDRRPFQPPQYMNSGASQSSVIANLDMGERTRGEAAGRS